jgi:hypothetical protein
VLSLGAVPVNTEVACGVSGVAVPVALFPLFSPLPVVPVVTVVAVITGAMTSVGVFVGSSLPLPCWLASSVAEIGVVTVTSPPGTMGASVGMPSGVLAVVGVALGATIVAVGATYWMTLVGTTGATAGDLCTGATRTKRREPSTTISDAKQFTRFNSCTWLWPSTAIWPSVSPG